MYTIERLFSSSVIKLSSLINYLTKINLPKFPKLVEIDVSNLCQCYILSMTNIEVNNLFLLSSKEHSILCISLYHREQGQITITKLHYEIKDQNLSNLRDNLITSKNVLILMLMEKIHDSLQLLITYSSENDFTTSSEEAQVFVWVFHLPNFWSTSLVLLRSLVKTITMQANTQGGKFKLDSFELFNQLGGSLKKIATKRVSNVTATKIFVTGITIESYINKAKEHICIRN
jgi:hypothetical protein